MACGSCSTVTAGQYHFNRGASLETTGDRSYSSIAIVHHRSSVFDRSDARPKIREPALPFSSPSRGLQEAVQRGLGHDEERIKQVGDEREDSILKNANLARWFVHRVGGGRVGHVAAVHLEASREVDL